LKGGRGGISAKKKGPDFYIQALTFPVVEMRGIYHPEKLVS
jgi:hypothetical protein